MTPRIYIVDCSPEGRGRTQAALDAVSAAALGAGAVADTGWVGDTAAALDGAVDTLAQADGVVFGSPVYRASYAYPLKRLLDTIPRGGDEHVDSPLAGKPVAIVLTGASLHHFLALDWLARRAGRVLCRTCLAPGPVRPDEWLRRARELVQPYAAQAAALGPAVVELASLRAQPPPLNSLRPQA